MAWLRSTRGFVRTESSLRYAAVNVGGQGMGSEPTGQKRRRELAEKPLVANQKVRSTNHDKLSDFRGEPSVGAGLSLHSCRTLPGETDLETDPRPHAYQARIVEAKVGQDVRISL